jgi:hypothetical protein
MGNSVPVGTGVGGATSQRTGVPKTGGINDGRPGSIALSHKRSHAHNAQEDTNAC